MVDDCWFGVGNSDYGSAGGLMLKVAAYILHSVAAFLLGCFWSVWFGAGGYGEIAWFGFVLGVVSYFAFVGFIAFMWAVVAGEKGE